MSFLKYVDGKCMSYDAYNKFISWFKETHPLCPDRLTFLDEETMGLWYRSPDWNGFQPKRTLSMCHISLYKHSLSLYYPEREGYSYEIFLGLPSFAAYKGWEIVLDKEMWSNYCVPESIREELLLYKAVNNL